MMASQIGRRPHPPSQNRNPHSTAMPADDDARGPLAATAGCSVPLDVNLTPGQEQQHRGQDCSAPPPGASMRAQPINRRPHHDGPPTTMSTAPGTGIRASRPSHDLGPALYPFMDHAGCLNEWSQCQILPERRGLLHLGPVLVSVPVASHLSTRAPRPPLSCAPLCTRSQTVIQRSTVARLVTPHHNVGG